MSLLFILNCRNIALAVGHDFMSGRGLHSNAIFIFHKISRLWIESNSAIHLPKILIGWLIISIIFYYLFLNDYILSVSAHCCDASLTFRVMVCVPLVITTKCIEACNKTMEYFPTVCRAVAFFAFTRRSRLAALGNDMLASENQAQILRLDKKRAFVTIEFTNSRC